MDETRTNTAQPRADQDQIQANYVGEVEKQITAILQSPETLALTTARGYGSGKLRAGLEKVAAFQEATGARQGQLGPLKVGAGDVHGALTEAKSRVTDLRESARIAFPRDKAAQKALGATGAVPQDQEKLIVFARACLTTARTAPYFDALKEAGFDDVGYESAVEELAARRAAFTVVEQSAKKATEARDAAFREVKDWAQPFRRAAKLALKDRPDLRTPLGL